MSGAQLTVVLWAESHGEVSRASGLSTPPSVLWLRSVPGSAEVMPSWLAPASASVRLFFFFLPYLEGMGSFPDQGSGPLQWKPGVLTSGVPGKFPPLPLGSNSLPHMGRVASPPRPWISLWQFLLSSLPPNSLLSSRQTQTLHLFSSRKPSWAN